MDDAGRSTLRTAVVLLTVAALCSQPGCSLFVMTGKMLLGNPTKKCAFSAATRVNLVREKKKVLVICSVPDGIQLEFPSIESDLSDRVLRRLKLRDINVVDPNKVIDWIEERGGVPSDPSRVADELARSFEADYIVVIDLENFAYTAENSPSMYQGHAEGKVQGYEVRKIDGTPTALHVFPHEFHSVYPRFSPRPAHEMSKQAFVSEYLGRLSLELAQLFYDHPVSEEIQ